LLEAGDVAAKELTDALRANSIGQVLRLLNSPRLREATLAPYLELLLPISTHGNWAGPDMVANWYRRNFRIAASLLSTTTPGDRVLVIFGAGHAPVLEHVLRHVAEVNLVDPFDYLDLAT
jgi:hypothetical protein